MESGARGMITELEKRQIQVLEFPYPAPNRYRHSVAKGLAYLLGLPVLFSRVLLSSRQFDVLHLTVLYRHFVYPELALVIGARVLRRPVLLNLRPGDWWLQYQQRSTLYRYAFRLMVRLSQRVAVESYDLMEPIRLLGVEPVYLPSFVTQKPRKREDRGPQCTTVKLVYLGSLNDAKGIPIALEVRRHLEARGLDAVLVVIGGGDPAYVEKLRKTYRESEVQWLGEVAHEDVRKVVGDSDFFLFPTTFFGEGHSNALNECMAEGVVPIVSDHGANRRVVGDGGVVLKNDAAAGDYAAAIDSLWASGEWPIRSRICTSIIAEHFYAPVVMDRLVAAYREIISEE
jgi:glycosyltransferase involved in cell wall biosynthesis